MIILLLPNAQYYAHSWWGQFPARIAEAAAAKGIETRVMYMKIVDTPPAWVDPECVNVQDLYDLRWCLRTVRRLAANNRRVVVHQHTVPIHTALWLVRPLLHGRCRTVFTDHDPPTASAGGWRPLKKCIKRTLRAGVYYPEWIVPVSEFNARVWRTHFGSRNVMPILNGVEIPPTPEMKQPPSSGPWEFTYLGRLMKEKGVWQLLEAAQQAAREKLPAHFSIYGFGPEESAVQDFIARNNLSASVHFAGATREPSAAFRNAHVTLIPSQWNEPLCLVSMESMAHGVPAIYTQRGGLPETQVDGVTGYMLQNGYAEEIVAAIKQVLQRPEALAPMSRAARHHAEHHFSMERMVNQYLELYLSLLHSKAG